MFLTHISYMFVHSLDLAIVPQLVARVVVENTGDCHMFKPIMQEIDLNCKSIKSSRSDVNKYLNSSLILLPVDSTIRDEFKDVVWC